VFPAMVPGSRGSGSVDERSISMLRRLVFGLCVFMISAGGLLADDFFAAKVKKVDKNAKIFKVEGKGKKATNKNIAGGLQGLKEGDPVTVWTETKDDKDVVTQVRVDSAIPKKKKNQ